MEGKCSVNHGRPLICRAYASESSEACRTKQQQSLSITIVTSAQFRQAQDEIDQLTSQFIKEILPASATKYQGIHLRGQAHGFIFVSPDNIAFFSSPFKEDLKAFLIK